MMNLCKDRKIISVEEGDAVPKSVPDSFIKNWELSFRKGNSDFKEAISIFWGNCTFISLLRLLSDIRVQ